MSLGSSLGFATPPPLSEISATLSHGEPVRTPHVSWIRSVVPGSARYRIAGSGMAVSDVSGVRRHRNLIG